MDDYVAFTVGEPTRNHLGLTVLRRFAESPDDWFDYGSLECRVDIRAQGIRAGFNVVLRSEGFEKLRDDLAELDRAFTPGSVRFEPGYEQAITFTILVGQTGTIWIDGTAIDGLGSGIVQKLAYGFAVADSLRSIISTADAVTRAFPSSPMSPLRTRRGIPGSPS
jgi:hypothetical protein